jgi:hypothetical protein
MAKKIDRTELSPTERKMEFKKLAIKEQVECRYLAIEFGKELQKR